jgi:hypothetical protein
MKSLKFVLSFVFLFAAIFAIIGCTEVSANDTYVTLDINPSIELIVNRRDKVIYANALNEDGEVLLADLDLIGMNAEDAIDLIIETATQLGFIDPDAEETYVSVTAISKDSAFGDQVRDRIKAHINNAFAKRYMMGKAQDKAFTPEFVAEAESYGVTPGFLFMVKSALIADDELLIEEALLLTPEELQTIIKTAKAEMREVSQAIKEEFFTAREALFAEYLPQIQALEQTIELGEGDIDALTLELEALKLEFRTKLEALRTEFHTETEAIRAQMKEVNEQRRAIFEPIMNQHMEQMQERREEMQEKIDELIKVKKTPIIP